MEMYYKCSSNTESICIECYKGCYLLSHSDISIERIGGLLEYDLSAILSAARGK
jgi:hypothetical protein